MLKNRINSFDGLRGIAILLVVIYHSQNTIKFDSDIWNVLSIFIANSSLGVRIFFVLSGYLITRILLKEVNETGVINLRKFNVRRAIRLFPSLYCFVVSVFLINAIAGLNIANKDFIAASTFTWNYFGIFETISYGKFGGTWFFGHLWTLALEAQFYLLWPLMLLFISNKYLHKLSLFLVLSMPIVRVASYFLFPVTRGYLNIMLHTSIDSIMMGCFMAILTQSPIYRNRISKIKGYYIAMLVTWLVFISPILDYLIRGYLISIGITLNVICLGILIVWLHNNPSSYLSKLLSNPILVYVGQISYSVYIWQQLFLTDQNTTITGIFPYNIGFSILAGMVSYYLIEKPTFNLKDNNKILSTLGLRK
ncbi:acyltransferase [Nostoc sp. FACHB-190]|uniref:acyltransferase family protein n=1 Tax=Nostoc sp. FACHB-190 TaxID=2692838 RepID=UPI00168440D4|nr:acyltransferase [Nostoc sp. FACHB-190]MBD2297288.1 acyltransferase [Nostoc sp. FACHB-190]